MVSMNRGDVVAIQGEKQNSVSGSTRKRFGGTTTGTYKRTIPRANPNKIPQNTPIRPASAAKNKAFSR